MAGAIRFAAARATDAGAGVEHQSPAGAGNGAVANRSRVDAFGNTVGRQDDADALVTHSARTWQLVVLELGLAATSDLLGRANTLCDSLLGDRFTNRVSLRLMRHATALDLAAFEDPVFYDKLERARKQTTGRLGLLASLLSLAQDVLSQC